MSYHPEAFQHHSHYRADHVEVPISRGYSTSSQQQQSARFSPYHFERDQDASDYDSTYSIKRQPLDLDPVTSHQRPVYPMLHKDASNMSEFSSDRTAFDARSISTSRFPQHHNIQHQQLAPPEPRSGFWMRILPSSIACRLYLLTVLIETVVDIAIEVDLLVLVKNSPVPKGLEFDRLPVYLAVFGLAHLFQLALALDAVHAQNTLQFLFLAVFNALLLAYAVIQRDELPTSLGQAHSTLTNIPVGALTAIIIAIIGLSEVAYIALGYKIYTEFGWKVYKLLGADRAVKRMYMHLQVFLCLIKFDGFFFIGFTVQWIFLVLDKGRKFEYYVTIVALPFSILVLALGHVAARKENKWLMGTFISGLMAACVYFIYKFWKILRFRNDEALIAVFKSLTIFSVLAVALLMITFAWAVIVMHNFGAGLKGKVTKHRKGQSLAFSSRTGRTGTTAFEMGTHPHRLSID